MARTMPKPTTTNLSIVFNITCLVSILLATSHSVSQLEAPSNIKSPNQYLQEYTSQCLRTGGNVSRRRPTWDECDREPTAWRWQYVQEPLDSRRLLVKESTVDERLANVQYTCNSARVSYNDAFKFASGSRELDARNEQLVAGARVNDHLCGKHLRSMIEQIDQLSERLAAARDTKAQQQQQLDLDEKFLHLAKVLDSFGRYQSGHLSGRSQVVGDYHQCLAGSLLLASHDHDDNDQTSHANKSSLTSTRYCWARMATGARLDGALRARVPNIEMQDQVLSSGICIPASCHTRNFKQYRRLFERLVASQFKLPSELYLHQKLELESIFCLVDQDSPYLLNWPLSAKLFLMVITGWLLLIFRATYSSRSSRIARCLDVRESWLEFTEQHNSITKAPNSQRRLVDLSTLNLAKVIMCAYVVLGHTAMMHYFNAQNQLRALLENEIDPVSTAIVVGTFSVDTFLTITGVLVAWFLLRKFDKFKRPPGARGYLTLFLGLVSMRYLRLVPLYFLVYWFKKSLFARLGSGGPFWDYGFNAQTSLGACEYAESWLTPFELTSCYLPLFKQCLTPTWSIAIDFRLCVLVTPVVLLAYRFRASAKLMLATAWLYCCYLGYNDVLAIEPEILFDIADCKNQGIGQFFNKYAILYTTPKLRFCCMVIGALAGIMLYEYENKNNKNKTQNRHAWPRFISGPLTIAAITWIILFFITLLNTRWVQANLAPHHKLMMYNLVTLRAVWSLANAIVFLRMPTDWSTNALMRLSSMQLWKILSKLNLVILLIHWDLIVYYQNQQIDTHNLKKWNWFVTFGGVYLFSLILGTFIHITIQNPLDRLIRVYLFGERLEGLANYEQTAKELALASEAIEVEELEQKRQKHYPDHRCH